MYETQQTEQQNVIADEHLPIEGEQSPSQKCLVIDRKCKMVLLCEDCGQPITKYKSLSKRFCDACKKNHKNKQIKQWKKSHPEKERIYQFRKRLKKAREEGSILRANVLHCVDCASDISDRPNSIFCAECSKIRKKTYSKKRNQERDWKTYCRKRSKKLGCDIRFDITHCLLCGKDISDRFTNAKYCEECSKEIPNYKLWYHAEEIENRIIMKKSLVTRCIICGRDISMYSVQATRCDHCKEAKLKDIGTVTFSCHMRRKWSGMPDWKAERKAIDLIKNTIGL